MKPECFEVAAISTEPGVVPSLYGGRDMLSVNHFRESEHRFAGIHWAILMHERASQSLYTPPCQPISSLGSRLVSSF